VCLFIRYIVFTLPVSIICYIVSYEHAIRRLVPSIEALCWRAKHQ
jgi:hypothetical protein